MTQPTIRGSYPTPTELLLSSPVVRQQLLRISGVGACGSGTACAGADLRSVVMALKVVDKKASEHPAYGKTQMTPVPSLPRSPKKPKRPKR